MANGDGYVSIWDRVWTDDLGGTVAKVADKINPIDDFSSIPVAGPAASKVGSLVTRLYEGTNRIQSWGISAAPAGVETLDWNTTAGQVSVGQTAVANAVKLGKQVPAFGAVEPATKIIEKWDPENPILTDEFNLRTSTAEDRKRVFEESGPGKVLSGATDTAVQFFLDPAVVFGKGIKIARFGGKIGGVYEVSGLTNRTIASGKMVQKVGDEADTALKIARGEITGTRDNTLGIYADEITRGSATDLLEHPLFENNPHRDLLAGIGGRITDKEDAITFIAAASGNQKYIKKLHDDHHSAYDSMSRALKPNLAEVDEFRRPIGEWTDAMRAKAREVDVNIGMVLEDLVRRNDALAQAVGVVSNEGDALLRTAGAFDSAVTAWGAKVASAYRASRATRRKYNAGDIMKDEVNGIDAMTNVGQVRKSGIALTKDEISRLERKKGRLPVGTGPAVAEQTFQASSFDRVVRVWDWIGGYHASGMIDVRGSNVGKSSDELHAALTDSKTIRQDRSFVEEQMNIYLSAIDPTAKRDAVYRIEQNVISKLMKDNGITDRDALDDLYKKIHSRRSKMIQQFKERGYGVDENNNIIKATPQLVSQLETSVPMMDMNMLEKSVKILKRQEYSGNVLGKAINDAKNGAAEWTPVLANFYEELQSIWKAGVLIRLGYTQRNVGEGWLRSAAALGTIPAFKNIPLSVKNFSANMGRRGSSAMNMGTLLRAEKDIIKQHNANIALLAKTKGVRARRAIENENEILIAQMDDIVARKQALQRRDFIGSQTNEYGYGAFAGDLGNMYRKMASNESTVDKALRSQWQRESNVHLTQGSWVKVNPGDKQYWDELATSIRQFRSDPASRLALSGMSAEKMAREMVSDSFINYRRDMQMSKKDMPAQAAKIHAMVNRYLPTEQVRAAANAADVAPEQLQLMLGNLVADAKVLKKPKADNFIGPDGLVDNVAFGKAMDNYKNIIASKGTKNAVLSPIHGKDIAKHILSDKSFKDLFNLPINAAFKVIGTLPESRLVRQPFYAEVWNREFNRIVETVKSQGGELTDDVLERINKNAHTVALRAVNETLYTIERFSNLAAIARWIAPFFPAWENSTKVWIGLVAKDPSILPRASILWNIPNNMGLVVDEKGKPVGQERTSFLTGSQNRFIVLPKDMNDVFMKFSGGVPFKMAQGAANIVTPGETPYSPGMGPTGAFATGLVLQSKPDWQDAIRKHAPVLWQQIAPLDTVTADPSKIFLPTVAQNFLHWWRGESDMDFLSVLGSIVQSSIVDWYASGGDRVDKPDSNDLVDKARNFFVFKMIASLVSPVALTRESKHQVELDAWRAIQSDTADTRTYAEKQRDFLDKYGEEFLPLTASTSSYGAGYFAPSQNSYKIIRDHGDLINQIAASSPEHPELVGMLISTAPVGEFDPSVYKWLGENTVPGTNDTWRSKPNAMVMMNSIEMQRAFREYRAVKEERDQDLASRGLKSMQSKGAEDIKAAWNYFTKTQMAKKYGNEWLIAFQTFTDTSAASVITIKSIMDESTATGKKFMSEYGDTELWKAVGTYMDMRKQATDDIAAGNISAADAQKVFAEWAAGFKNTNYQFADFYDKYLEYDKLSAGVGD